VPPSGNHTPLMVSIQVITALEREGRIRRRAGVHHLKAEERRCSCGSANRSDSGNHNGITGTQQNRLDSTPPAHLLDNYHVYDNLICAAAGQHPTGVVADNGANLGDRDISFTPNTIQSFPCE
jgi:hypothetical protein